MTKISFEIPIKTVSEANCSEHWTKKAKRHKQQQFFIRLALQKYVKDIKLPCTVLMTRLSPRTLDDDNLRTCLKYIRDEISECLIPEKTGSYISKKGKVVKIKGRADSDPRITWEYAQEKQSSVGIKIEIDYTP